MQGDFSTDNADNNGICPHGFILGAQNNLGVGPQSPSAPFGGYGGGGWCSDLSTTVLAAGGTYATLPTLTPTGTYTSGTTVYNTDAGQKYPAGFLDPGSAALAKIWPAANRTPSASVCNGCNYYKAIVNVDNGWIWRTRIDYLLGDNTKIYGSYEQAFSAGLGAGQRCPPLLDTGQRDPVPWRRRRRA